jgi:RHS repeat-associated protein
VDALGNVRTWRYDAAGNVVETLARDGQDGRNPSRTLNAAGLVTLAQTQNAYDERSRLYAERRALFTADMGTGALTPLTTDGDGWVETAYAYDRSSNLVALTDDRGNRTAYAYDGLGRLALHTDALNNTVAYTYDGDHNLVQTVATERQPDGLAPVETFTNLYTYDAANRLVSATDNLGQTSRYAYDSRNNRVFRSDANGAVTANGKSQIVNGESPIPNLQSAIPGNAHGNTALFTYDGQNRLLSATYHLRAGGLGDGAVTGQVTMSYAYDANGNRTRQTDPNGHATVYAYDALDRLTRTTYADGTAMTYIYDKAGNLTRQTDPTGSVIVHAYDAADRRIRTDVTRGVGVGGTTLQTFAWDGRSRLVAATDNNDPATAADDSSLVFAYDSLSNVRRATQDGRTVTSAHDGLGNRLTLLYPGGTALVYTYDALNRVKTIADGSGTVATYDYLGPVRVLRRTNANGTYVAYTYDAGRRLTGLAYRRSSDNSLVTGFSYTYDRAGNRLTETAQPGNRQTTYTYDSLNRLVGAQLPTSNLQSPISNLQSPISNLQYAYDPAGNRTQVVRDGLVMVYATNEMNEYLSVGGKSYTHDENGNLTLAGSQAYRYDFLGRLIGSTPPLRLYLPLLLRRGAGGSEIASESQPLLAPEARPTAMTTAYDALGRPVKAQTGSAAVRYIYDRGQAIEERDDAGNLLATYVDELTVQRGAARFYYLTDAGGSVRNLIDGNGDTREWVDYDAFGAPSFGTGGRESRYGNPYLFHGLRYDASNGLYMVGGRRYDPGIGRYLQRGPTTLGNPYAFAGNNPAR